MDSQLLKTKSAAQPNVKTDRAMEALAVRANGLADQATQSIKELLAQETGHRVSNATESTIKMVVRFIIKAAVATVRYEDASS
jgi:hypothetical protein